MKSMIGAFLLVIMGTPLWASDSVLVLEMRGEAAVRTGLKGKWVPLKKGDLINAGQWIQTSLGARVYLKFWNNTITQVRAASLVEITMVKSEGLRQTSRLRLALGAVRVHVRHDRKEIVDFRVNSPRMTTAVKGTSYTQSVEGDVDGLVVHGGTVKVEKNNSSNVSQKRSNKELRTSQGSEPTALKIREKVGTREESRSEVEGTNLDSKFVSWSTSFETVKSSSEVDRKHMTEMIRNQTSDSGDVDIAALQESNKPK